MALIPLFVSLALAAWGSAGSGQDLREQVRKHRNVEILILKEYSPVDLPTLVAKAGIISRVLVTQAKSSLIGDQISTDYTVQVLSASKGQADLEGRAITVRRPGGNVSIEGGTAKARDPDFPPFEPGEEYVLFLNLEAEGHFTVPFGAQGAFRVDQGKVTQVSRDTGTWNRDRVGSDYFSSWKRSPPLGNKTQRCSRSNDRRSS